MSEVLWVQKKTRRTVKASMPITISDRLENPKLSLFLSDICLLWEVMPLPLYLISFIGPYEAGLLLGVRAIKK